MELETSFDVHSLVTYTHSSGLVFLLVFLFFFLVYVISLGRVFFPVTDF